LSTKGPDETHSLGKLVGSLLVPGDVVAITGELGAGKTTFIKGLAEGTGVSDFVSSPSFVIINEYSGKIPFFHVDLYRLNDLSEIEDIAIEEYFERKGIVAIEWAEKLKSLLPGKHIKIDIEATNESERKFIFTEIGIKRLKGKLG